LTTYHQKPRTLGHKQNTNTHDCAEYEGAAKDIAPISVNSDEHGGDGIAENLAKSNVELVQRYQVTAEARFDGLGNVNWDCAAFETDTCTENNSSGNNHAVVDAASFESSADSVKDTRDDNGPATSKVLVAGRDEKCTSDRCMRLARDAKQRCLDLENVNLPPSGIPELTKEFCCSVRPRAFGRVKLAPEIND
jgi:hypothetical protein